MTTMRNYKTRSRRTSSSQFAPFLSLFPSSFLLLPISIIAIAQLRVGNSCVYLHNAEKVRLDTIYAHRKYRCLNEMEKKVREFAYFHYCFFFYILAFCFCYCCIFFQNYHYHNHQCYYMFLLNTIFVVTNGINILNIKINTI